MNLWFVKYAVVGWLALMIPFQSTSTQEVSIQPEVERILPTVTVVVAEELSPREVIKQALQKEQPKITKEETQCALQIVYRESRYNVDAVNKSSGAQGAYQLMWGKPEWGLGKQTQQAVKYMKSRYGSWCAGLRHHDLKNWW